MGGEKPLRVAAASAALGECPVVTEDKFELGVVLVTCSTTGETTVCEGGIDAEVLKLSDCTGSEMWAGPGADKDGDVDIDAMVVVDGVDDSDLLYPGYTNLGGCTDVGWVAHSEDRVLAANFGEMGEGDAWLGSVIGEMGEGDAWVGSVMVGAAG